MAYRHVIRFYVVCAAVALIGCSQAQAAQRLEFRRVLVPELVGTLYSQMGIDYVLDGDFLASNAVVSLDVRGKSKAEVRRMLRVELQAAGFEEVEAAGVVRVRKRVDPDAMTYLYVPQHRPVAYLVELAALIVEGEFSSRRQVSIGEAVAMPEQQRSEKSAAGLIDVGADVLVFRGLPIQIDRLASLLPQLDTPRGQILVRGAIYEVRNEGRTSSAVSLVGELLKGKLGIEFGNTVQGDRLTLRVGDLSAVFSALGQDTRFKSISRPQLRVRSGESATVSVGAEVPVLGQVTVDNRGQAVQSVEYRSSGVILTLTPRVYRGSIDLDVSQEVSAFVATQTGVNNSPTLLKRAVTTKVAMVPGEVVVLGGLEQSGKTDEERGPSWLPRLLKAKGSIDESTELVVLLSVDVL